MSFRRIFLVVTLLSILHTSYSAEQCTSKQIADKSSACQDQITTSMNQLSSCSTNENEIISFIEGAADCFKECNTSGEVKAALAQLSNFIVSQINEKCATGTVVTGRQGGCDVIKAQACPTQLAPFTSYDAFNANVLGVESFCQQNAGLVSTISDCSNTLVGCAGLFGALPALFNSVQYSINVANEFTQNACTCNADIKSSIDNFGATTRQCAALVASSQQVMQQTNQCVQRFYGSLKPFRFDVMANGYVGTFLNIIPVGCSVPFDFQASSASKLGSRTAIVLSIFVLFYNFWKN